MPVTIIALCSFFSVHSDPNVVRGHNVINVIIPESRIHFFQQLGYVLATLLLFVVLLIIVVFITRKRRQRGECWKTPSLECWEISRGRRGDSASNYCAAQCLLKASQQRGLNSCYALLFSGTWEVLVGLDITAHSISSPCLGYEYNVKKYGE